MPASVSPARSKSASYRARRIHRWLGLCIGVQFLIWTIGGLYFSWTRLDEVHGDHLTRAQPLHAADARWASPSDVVAALRARGRVDSIAGVELARVAGRPTWRVSYVAHDATGPVHRVQLADAASGVLREPLSRDEAIAAARAAYAGPPAVERVEYLATAGSHHEYRGQPLPAWAVRFGGPEGATAYVSAEQGHVVRIRNDRWRVFDFLWMMHTMDFRGRDDFNNVVLRAFSVFGLVTVMSGLVLFVLTSRPVLARRHRRPELELQERAAA